MPAAVFKQHSSPWQLLSRAASRIQYQKGFEIDALLLGIATSCACAVFDRRLIQSARPVCGLSPVTDLRSGQVFDIGIRGLVRGLPARRERSARCRTAINDAIAANVDLLVVNRFGRAESLGRGLIGSFTAAIEAGIPILTAVRPPYDEAWRAFHGGIGCELMAEPESAMTWALSVTEPSSVRASRVA